MIDICILGQDKNCSMIFVLLFSILCRGTFLGNNTCQNGESKKHHLLIKYTHKHSKRVKGDNDESQDNLTLVFGAGPSAERLRDADDPARG